MGHELSSLFPNDISILSAHDMARIKVGAPAVSRHHQVKRLFLENDTPNLNDHDFPVPGYLLNVSRHMFLENHPTDTRDHSNDSASNHDETLAYGFQNGNVKHSFENMTIEKKEGNIFDIIKRQDTTVHRFYGDCDERIYSC